MYCILSHLSSSIDEEKAIGILMDMCISIICYCATLYRNIKQTKTKSKNSYADKTICANLDKKDLQLKSGS